QLSLPIQLQQHQRGEHEHARQGDEVGEQHVALGLRAGRVEEDVHGRAHRATASLSESQVVRKPIGMTSRQKPIAMVRKMEVIRFGLNSIIVLISPEASATEAAAATVVFLVSAIRVLPSGVTAPRSACGRTMMRAAGRNERPMARAASAWPSGTVFTPE